MYIANLISFPKAFPSSEDGHHSVLLSQQSNLTYGGVVLEREREEEKKRRGGEGRGFTLHPPLTFTLGSAYKRNVD